MITECCSESRMRPQMSRGVPEWSGGEDLYMGSHHTVTGSIRGLSVLYRDHRKGLGGPPGRATYLGGPHGLKWEGNQPLVGWCAPFGPPPVPRVGNPRGGGGTWLGRQATPLAAPLEIQSLGGGAPQGPYIKRRGVGLRAPAPGASLSLCTTSPSR